MPPRVGSSDKPATQKNTSTLVGVFHLMNPCLLAKGLWCNCLCGDSEEALSTGVGTWLTNAELYAKTVVVFMMLEIRTCSKTPPNNPDRQKYLRPHIRAEGRLQTSEQYYLESPWVIQTCAYCVSCVNRIAFLERQADRKTETQTDRQKDMGADRRPGRQKDTQPDRPTRI